MYGEATTWMCKRVRVPSQIENFYKRRQGNEIKVEKNPKNKTGKYPT